MVLSNLKRFLLSSSKQEWRPSLDQEDPEPPHIKEEQEEVRTSQEGGQLQGFTFTLVPVKNEDDDDDEKPQSSQLHQRLTEQMKTDDGEDCGGPEPDTIFGQEEVPPEQQQEWSRSLDQEDPEPEHIKEEQEEVRTSQEGEQLQRFTFTPVPQSNSTAILQSDSEGVVCAGSSCLNGFMEEHFSQCEDKKGFLGMKKCEEPERTLSQQPPQSRNATMSGCNAHFI
ncbi:uncharacterized protein LOC127358287 [Dicentrarchus labrax]|uniref:uncharacterized protein LOC127358287 n=1 Tax=Dicentrarchus labrax TaxID=13489 RepID=UPI0021F65233|nr:uncharacterized protein LOC127358287 [Dicentrarchus labrax]